MSFSPASASLFSVSPISYSAESFSHPLTEFFQFSPSKSYISVVADDFQLSADFLLPHFLHSAESLVTQPQSIFILSLRHSVEYFNLIARKQNLTLKPNSLTVLSPLDFISKISTPSLSTEKSLEILFSTAPEPPLLTRLLEYFKLNSSIEYLIVDDLEFFLSIAESRLQLFEFLNSLVRWLTEKNRKLLVVGHSEIPSHMEILNFLATGSDSRISISHVKQKIFSSTSAPGLIELVKTPVESGNRLDQDRKLYRINLMENQVQMELIGAE